MKTMINKYPIASDDITKIQVPIDSMILCVKEVGNENVVYIERPYIGDKCIELETLIFKSVFTGHTIDVQGYVYIGTIVGSDGVVDHIYMMKE